jgi:hypothetical protein
MARNRVDPSRRNCASLCTARLGGDAYLTSRMYLSEAWPSWRGSDAQRTEPKLRVAVPVGVPTEDTMTYQRDPERPTAPRANDRPRERASTTGRRQEIRNTSGLGTVIAVAVIIALGLLAYSTLYRTPTPSTQITQDARPRGTTLPSTAPPATAPQNK